jgi:hypothetical protein
LFWTIVGTAINTLALAAFITTIHYVWVAIRYFKRHDNEPDDRIEIAPQRSTLN